MNVNPLLWYSLREVKVPPPHFIQCVSLLSEDSLLWVMSKLQGRFSVINDSDDEDFLFPTNKVILFEDPTEAMMYELRWSGAK